MRISNSKVYSKLQIQASFFAALFATSCAAFSWGYEGHQTIALIADSKLTPKARAGVQKLLALEPGSTLASVSTWADEHRNPATAAWHYVSFPRGDCVYDKARDCPDGRCVVVAIQKQLEILSSQSSDDRKLTALKYLVHFMGDVHQPLHAGPPLPPCSARCFPLPFPCLQ